MAAEQTEKVEGSPALLDASSQTLFGSFTLAVPVVFLTTSLLTEIAVVIAAQTNAPVYKRAN